jgi:rRNA maturation protein Rpf1
MSDYSDMFGKVEYGDALWTVAYIDEEDGRPNVMVFADREEAEDMESYLKTIGITADIRFQVIQDPEEFDEE